MSRIHAESVMPEWVLCPCPYCGKSVLGFHNCSSLGGKVGFHYLQLDDKSSQFWGLLGYFFLFLLGGIFLYIGISHFNEGEFGALFGVLGLGFLIFGAIESYKRLRDIREGVVAVLEGPISRRWKESHEDGYSYNIEVLGQEQNVEEGLWNMLMEGDTVRTEQLPRSKVLLRVERIPRGSNGRTEKPLITYPDL